MNRAIAMATIVHVAYFLDQNPPLNTSCLR